jgi:hypothetical protein
MLALECFCVEVSILQIFCGCKSPVKVDADTFYQATDVKIFSPISMKFGNYRTIETMEECIMSPVYENYICRCYNTQKNYNGVFLISVLVFVTFITK